MSWASGTTGGRISQLLDAIDFNDRTNFWQGGIQADGTRLTGALDTGDTITIGNADGSKSALAIIQDLLEAERGVFYISKDGKATYEERNSRARRTSSTATLTTYALTSQPGFEFDQLVNRQSVTRQFQTGAAATSPNTLASGTTQVAQNSASARLFGLVDGSELTSEYIASDTQAANLAQFIVNIRSSFVAPVTIEMDGGPAAAVTQMLSVELQDRVTVTDATAGTSGDYIIEGIETEITDGGNRFTVTFTLSDYGPPAFVFGSSTQAVFAPPDGTVTYTVCPNAPRPASPPAGANILESDTGRYYKRVSGAWVEQTYPRLSY
ncbi:MAG: hypothetical protein ACO3HV_07065 [Candidatus Nanopelagicales bacterium]